MKPPVDYDFDAVRAEAHNFPMNSEDYTLEDLHRVQARLLEMATIIDDILTKEGIKHSLAWGSLLGAIRHKGFIPWDDDLDFWVLDEQYDDALAALRENLPEDLIVHDETNDPIYWVKWSRVRDLKSEVLYDQYANDRHYRYRGICIDLYRLRVVHSDDIASTWMRERRANAEAKLVRGIITEEEIQKYYKWFDEMYQRWFVEYEPRLFGPLYTDNFNWAIMEVDKFWPETRVDFENVQFPVPRDPVDVLDHIFEAIKWWELPPFEERRVHYSKVVFF